LASLGFGTLAKRYQNAIDFLTFKEQIIDHDEAKTNIVKDVKPMLILKKSKKKNKTLTNQ